MKKINAVKRKAASITRVAVGVASIIMAAYVTINTQNYITNSNCLTDEETKSLVSCETVSTTTSGTTTTTITTTIPETTTTTVTTTCTTAPVTNAVTTVTPSTTTVAKAMTIATEVYVVTTVETVLPEVTTYETTSCSSETTTSNTTSTIVETTTVSTTTNVVLKDIPLSDDLNQYIYDNAVAQGLPYEFVLAVIKQESNFNSKAVSSSNCIGLMQVSKRYNKDVNLFDPYANIKRGCQILHDAYTKAGGSIRMAYTYYNLGLYTSRRTPNQVSQKVYNYYIGYLNQ